MEELSPTSLSDTSTELNLFSESSNSVDNLLESMDEQINDLYQIVKCQKEEIEELKKRVDVLKNLIQSNLVDHLNNIISYI